MMKAPMTSSSCDHHVDNDDDVYSNVQDQNIQVYVNVTRPDAPYDPLIPPTHPVPINELGHHVALYHGDNNKQFNQQYQVIYDDLMSIMYHLYGGWSYRNYTKEMIKVSLLVSVNRMCHLIDSRTLHHVSTSMGST